MLGRLVVIGALAAGLVGVAYFAWPHAWKAYEDATNPKFEVAPQPDYDPDFGQRTTAEWLERCQPSQAPYDWLVLDSNCVADFAERPQDAALLTPRLYEFLHSPNALDVAHATLILGWFDERAAAPKIAGLLRSNDWRVVLAATRTLGWLGARDALPELDRTAKEHWMPQIRFAAASSARAIRDTGALPRPRTLSGEGGLWSELWPQPSAPEASCPGDLYRWKGQPIRFGTGAVEVTTVQGEHRHHRERTLLRARGRLVGSDAGEWGGALLWRPWLARATVLHDQNTFDLTRSGDTVMGLFGSRHGVADVYAAEIVDDGGSARLGPPIQFAGDAYGLSAVSPGVFAVRGDAGVLVFDNRRILGLAECAF